MLCYQVFLLFHIILRNGRSIILLAHNALKYLIPKIAELEPEQILELREHVANYREGFSMHLQSLSAGIEERLKGDETVEELSKYARNIIETLLIPDYREFTRILRAQEKKRKGKILDITGQVFQIDAPIPSLRFVGDLIRVISGAINSDAEVAKEQFSNRNQAYYFMQTAERSQFR